MKKCGSKKVYVSEKKTNEWAEEKLLMMSKRNAKRPF